MCERKIKCCLNCLNGFHPDNEFFGYCDFVDGGVITPLTETCEHFEWDEFQFIQSEEQLRKIQDLWKTKDPSLGITFAADYDPLKEVQ